VVPGAGAVLVDGHPWELHTGGGVRGFDQPGAVEPASPASGPSPPHIRLADLRPLETYQTVVNLIANTTTTTGLTVQREIDPNLYPTKIKLTDQQKKTIPLSRHDFHSDWNYTIMPRIDSSLVSRKLI